MNTVELDTDIISIILIGMLSLSDTSAISSWWHKLGDEALTSNTSYCDR